MIATLAGQEHARISVQTRRAQIASFLTHLVLLALLAMRPIVFPEGPTLTEFSWIDPESLLPASPPPGPASPPPGAAAPAATAPAVQAGRPRVEERQFERTLTRSETAPALQTSRTFQDLLNARVTSMQREARTSMPPIAAPTTVPMAGSQLAGVGTSPTGAPLGLHRGGSGPGGGGTGSGGGSPAGGTRPLALVRAGTGMPATSLPQLATVSAPRRERARPQAVETNGRDLAGASLLGPIADRPIVESATPAYPGWAEVQGVEVSVSLYFVVRPDGRIKENILVEKTSGFEDFDSNAVAALRRWRFQALGPGSNGEQWGRITFNFRLSAG